jgi:Tfp pilus assembly protein PilX
MRARLGQQSGWTVVIAIFTMTAMISMGLAAYAYVGGQQNQTRDERVRVSAFQLSEAAFNSATNFLNNAWPKSTSAYPSSCTQASSGSTCPDPSSVTSGSALDSTDFGAGQYSWSTEVHDNNGPTASYYSDSTTRTYAGYDANNDGVVWVRSQATVRGRTKTIVALVKARPASVVFPPNVLTAGKFATSNAGRKTMIDTTGGTIGQSGGVVVRCTPSPNPPTTYPDPSGCVNYSPSKGQVSPNNVQWGYAGGNAINSTDLQKLRDLAIANGTDYTSCPASLTGAMVFIEGPATCSYTANANYNSASSPGMVVIVNGTLSMTGTINYYGVIYAANQQNSSGNVVTIGGNTLVTGSIAVDGNGGALIGSSKKNLVYNPNVFTVVTGRAGISVIQNTWRVL